MFRKLILRNLQLNCKLDIQIQVSKTEKGLHFDKVKFELLK